MSIVLDESVMAIWYVSLADDLDLMLALSRDGDGGYKVNGRTRMYASKDDPWDENDRKRWFGGPFKADNDEAAILKSRDHMVTLSASFASTFKPDATPVLFELVRGESSVEKFGEKLRSMPWAHEQKKTVQ